MNVAQLLHKLTVVPYIEIVVALLPEVFGVADKLSRNALLQRLDRDIQLPNLGLRNEQVNMLGHHNVAVDPKPVLAPYSLQRMFESSLTRVALE